MPSVTVQPHQFLERILSLEIVRVTERAAVSAARLRGRGNEKDADQAAVDAMRRELNKLPIHGTVVIGEGERDAPPAANIEALAKAKGVKPTDITALVLDRPRHADLIAALRKAGASVRLITDGDVAGVIHTADADNTGIDIYLGIGGAPEGVLAAAALRCIGGQMQGRLILDNEEKRSRAEKMGV